MNRGYIKLWRKIFDEGWYTKPLTCHLAIHLILKANHKDKKLIFNKEEMVIKRGQLVTGRDKLSKETGLTHRNIRTSLLVLKNCDFLTIKVTNKFSIITICNYDQYQDLILPSDQQIDQQVTSKGPTSDHKQVIKELKNGKDIHSPSDEDSKALFQEWNSLGIIIHRNYSDFEACIKAKLKTFTRQKISEAMRNYKQVLSSNEYIFTYRWTLKQFLTRGLEIFLTVNDPFSNYRLKTNNNGTSKDDDNEY